MAFTDNCDLYAAVSEAGLNLIAGHILRQRPSLFNYATTLIVQHPPIACEPVAHTTDITTYNNPLFTAEPPLPLLGAVYPPVGLNYCAQLVDAKVDFFPGDVINLPAELNPPLPQQHFSMLARICAGLDCAWEEVVKIEPPDPRTRPLTFIPPPPTAQVPHGRELDCFCLDGYVIGHFRIENLYGWLILVGHVDVVDVVELAPPGLKQAINCYLRDTIEILLRQKLAFPVVHTFFFDFDFLKLPSITVLPAPNPPIRNNPAIEDDQLKIFIDFEVGP